MELCSFLIYLMVLIVHSFTAGLATTITDNTTDQSSLLVLKSHITHDPHSILAKNWSATASVCSWIGVTCSSRQHRVTVLDLSFMGLTGKISPHLGNLSFLIELRLRNNSFHGSLPIELVNMPRLKFVSFGFNNFHGEIPSWFGLLPRLQKLFLYGNNFLGSIPKELGDLANLEVLDLSNNQLSGSIPSTIFKISKLKSLDLSTNVLGGNIPEEIGNLTNLEVLSISENQVAGSIPSTIVNISSLKFLKMSFNKLSDSIPEDMCGHLPNLQELVLHNNWLVGPPLPFKLWQCRELQIVSLTYNKFRGSIPRNIGNLTSVTELYLGFNNLEGEIPQEIENLRTLETLSIPSSHLTGSIPKSLGNCTSLKALDLRGNSLTGTIPIQIGDLHNIETLHIGNNSFTGLIPSTIFNISTLKTIALEANHLSGYLPSSTGLGLPNLEKFYLSQNKLSGKIPSSVSNASKLTVLSLRANSFSGLIPNTLGNLRHLEVLELAFNYLKSESHTAELNIFSSLKNCKQLTRLDLDACALGTLPISIGNLSTSLQYFSASYCSIKGRIPREIANLSNLISLNLRKNELTGSIPNTIGRLPKLQGLYLEDNRLQGFIPNEVCHLKSLAVFYLRRNELAGSIPACLGNMDSLRILLLNSNNLTSTIPLNLWNIKDILVVNLSLNHLRGHLPLDIGKFKVVVYLDLSRNDLSGDIPSTIGGLQNLKILSLSRNRLQGSIPQSFGNLISLETLDLSSNNLSGEIPKSLEALLYLEHLNVSFNRLQGEIPRGGRFWNFSAQSFMWNHALCGAPQLQVPLCRTRTLQRSRTPMELTLYILLAIVTTILVVILIFMLIRCKGRSVKQQTQAELLLPVKWRQISYQELLQATDDFSKSNLLGVGGFSSVYKGTLPDGMNVAIKNFDLQVQGAFKSFDIECEVMSNTRHRNLIRVISSCGNKDFKALIVEYMPNGSLEKWLYSEKYSLDFLQRLNIMIDVASAMEYLHHGYSTPIIHCDLKPSNILLDEDMVAHVGDFGISKLLGGGASMTQTKTLATIGYMAPEYGSSGIVSTRGDVYSYGILLMETFTGKKPTDEMFGGEMNLKSWVKESLPHAVIEVVDANLLRSNKKEQCVATKDCLSSIMELALDCSAELPEERKNMKDVLATLKKIRMKFLKDVEGT